MWPFPPLGQIYGPYRDERARTMAQRRAGDCPPWRGKITRSELCDGLLQLEGADAVLVGALVAGVHAVCERLDERQERGVRARERGAVRGVVERQLGVLADLRKGGVRDREGARAAVAGELHRADHDRVGLAGRERDHEAVLVDTRETGDRVLARAGDDLGADVEKGEEV